MGLVPTPVEVLKAQLESPVRLQPGEAGYWQVWGANTYVIEVGDIIVTIDNDSNLVYDEVVSFEHQPTRVRIHGADESTFTLGHWFTNFKLFRFGTKNTLAKAV